MKATIALADDHQLVRKGIRLLLESISGFSVTIEASNGKELTDCIADEKQLPDIVLVDVNMPVMDGHETVSLLRSKYPEIKIFSSENCKYIAINHIDCLRGRILRSDRGEGQHSSYKLPGADEHRYLYLRLNPLPCQKVIICFRD